MASHTYMPLLIGIMFSVVGVLVIKLSSKLKKVAGLFPLSIGLFLIYLATAGPLSESGQKLNEVTRLTKDSILEIKIRPSRLSEGTGLTKKIVTISDPASIAEFATSLSLARETDYAIKAPEWTCVLEIVKKDKTSLYGSIRHAGYTCLLDVSSNIEEGWFYGSLESDKICSQILEATR